MCSSSKRCQKLFLIARNYTENDLSRHTTISIFFSIIADSTLLFPARCILPQFIRQNWLLKPLRKNCGGELLLGKNYFNFKLSQKFSLLPQTCWNMSHNKETISAFCILHSSSLHEGRIAPPGTLGNFYYPHPSTRRAIWKTVCLTHTIRLERKVCGRLRAVAVAQKRRQLITRMERIQRVKKIGSVQRENEIFIELDLGIFIWYPL